MRAAPMTIDFDDKAGINFIKIKVNPLGPHKRELNRLVNSTYLPVVYRINKVTLTSIKTTKYHHP